MGVSWADGQRLGAGDRSPRGSGLQRMGPRLGGVVSEESGRLLRYSDGPGKCSLSVEAGPRPVPGRDPAAGALPPHSALPPARGPLPSCRLRFPQGPEGPEGGRAVTCAWPWGRLVRSRGRGRALPGRAGVGGPGNAERRAGGARRESPGSGGCGGAGPEPTMSSPPSARRGFYRQEVTKTAWEVRAVYQDLQPVGSGAYGAVW